MTIAAQHVRAAINHLRGLDPRWRDVIRQVGPFAVRLERDPTAWLIQHLHADSLLDILSNPTLPTDAQPSLTDQQRHFAAELRSLQQHGRLDLSPSLPPSAWADRTAPLAELLDQHHSPLLPHFLFFCWGQLDHWPAEDRALRRCLHQLWPAAESPLPRVADDSTCAASAPSDNRNWPVDTWAPFRSVAAWYLARWSMNQARTTPHAKPRSE
jgi:hypothetical protein